MGDERPTFSIVIATHNRPQKVCALLESLQRLPSLSLKTVVVVDDSDAKVDLSDRFSNLSVRHICLEGGRVFLSKARNIGWRLCESDFVYFIDDDNVITETTLDGPFQVLLDHPEVAAVMPAVLYKENPNLVWVYATPLQPGNWGHILVGRNEPRVADLEGRLLPTDALPNAFVCRRDALDQIGGFDETLVMSSSADLAMRLESAGWKVYAHTGAFTLHDVEPPGRMGYWSSHRGVDPDRVFQDVRDWFILMRRLHPQSKWFAVHATRRALGFMVPNLLAYVIRRGPRGARAVEMLLRGYLSGLKATIGPLPRADPESTWDYAQA